jgi:hypothetical protein
LNCFNKLASARNGWIASRSLSSGARSRDPLARNDRPDPRHCSGTPVIDIFVSLKGGHKSKSVSFVSTDFGSDTASLACQVIVKKVQELALACTVAVNGPIQFDQDPGQVMKRQVMSVPIVRLPTVNEFHDPPDGGEGDVWKSVNPVFQRTHEAIGVI